MKSLNSCRFYTFALLLSIAPLSADAAVSFSFTYSDAPGTGFNDAIEGATRRLSLEESALTVGNWFNHTATIDIDVTSINDMSGTLASAGSSYVGGGPGFGNRGVVATKILGGADANGATADGSVNVNFGQNWDYDDTIDPVKFDFKSTMEHELLHAAGFLSGITQNGNDAFGNVPGTVGNWEPFDQFVADSGGALIAVDFKLDGGRWNTASVGESTLFFNGPNTLAANGGNPVRLFAPNPWQDGSSGSHLDDTDPALAGFLMLAATTAGPSARTLSGIEVGMLTDLGYSMVPEPSATLALLMGLPMIALRRRRR